MRRAWVLSVCFLVPCWAFAADNNLTAEGTSALPNSRALSLCEQLLNADLAGYYVVTNTKTRHSAFLQLRPIGRTGSYTVSRARLNLPAGVYSQLEPERTASGWLASETPEKRVNILSLERSGRDVVFRFEDTDDAQGQAHTGVPVDPETSVQGNILRPDSWTLDFRDSLGGGQVRFTRVNLDRAFEETVSQPLKSLIATRLHDENPGTIDYMITVEMKRPMTAQEACSLLESQAACAFDVEESSDQQRVYRFAVPMNIYEVLETVGRWTRNWEVARIDALSVRALNPALLTRIIERARSRMGATAPQLQAPPTPPRQAVPPQTSAPASAQPSAETPSKPGEAAEPASVDHAKLLAGMERELSGLAKPSESAKPSGSASAEPEVPRIQTERPSTVGGRPVIQTQPGKPEGEKRDERQGRERDPKDRGRS